MENFRIESLEINKIGAFEHIKMDFPKKTDPNKAEIHILTGENGTGKTTVLHLLSHCVPFKEDWLLEKFHPFANKNSNIKVGVSLFGSFIEVKGVRNYFKNIPKYFDEDKDSVPSYYKELPPDIIFYPNNGVFFFSLFAYSGYRKTGKVDLEGVTAIKGHPLENSLDFDKSISPELFTQWFINTKSKLALDFMQTVQNNGSQEGYEKYTVALELIENTVSEIVGRSIQLILDYNTFEVKVSLDKMQPVSLNHLPDGLLSIISWIGDLLMRLDRIEWDDNKKPINEQNIILFLDEIEVHLHPAWQRKILPVVQKLFKNAQIFISTHSPFVVGSVDGAWVHKLKKDGVFAVLDGEPVLSEDAESYETILEEIFGIKERFGDEIELKLREFREITKEILKGKDLRMEEWDNLVSFFENQGRPDEIMALITPQIRQINRIKNQVIA